MAAILKQCRLLHIGQFRQSIRQLHLNSRKLVWASNKTLRSYTPCCTRTSHPLKVAASHQPVRTFLSALSATGFNDYELGRRQFQLDVPEYFNFASDVLDVWAQKEQAGTRGSKTPALWWIDDHGSDIKWSFTDLQDKSKKVANILTNDCDLSRDESVTVILHRIPEWWLVNIACLRTGTILIPGTTQLTARDIRYRLQSSETACIITDEHTAPLVDEYISECPSVKSKLLISSSGESRPGWLDYHELYEKADSQHKCVKTRSDESMTMFFTSGTTGKAKLAVHTHASYGLGHFITGKYWLDLTPTDIHWNMSDTGWAKSAYSNFFGPWAQGACVFISYTARFDPVHTLELLHKYPVSTLCAPPTAYRMMVLEDLSKYNLKSIRHTVSAGEPLNPEVMESWKAGTGSMIHEGYGQTETVLLTGMFRCLEPRSGSMGKAAPGFDISIVDEDGNELPHGQEGDIGVRVKPHRPVGLFSHYVNDPERTARAYRGDFYLTGDRAVADDDGYLWFVGRGDDIINTSGYRIGPFEVESALIEHPAVAESAVVSSPDPKRGEVVKAFIVLTADYKSEDKEQLTQEIQNHVKSITAPYKYPRKIEFMESLPKTVSGKIRRVELRNQEWNQKVG
ncbi:acyl-coenzyme A synthetase ACSM3, mitochondrial-like [Patiria miniata]|uniref:medium-chain acyl-CoA ligase n=1 Tax=Patiria miniata TaxID=46514 RepID=A0A913Z9L9_PATMI|nr:acyl-coenzyme A synthetase ACSM3, mitochondrial-like [Patiria miniata]XP_038048325.1 acyl-coenzyme A synthetase ACSM3, mitochondrial-like [Patiria miniata]